MTSSCRRCTASTSSSATSTTWRQNETGTPFFAWLNTTHMHFRTHTRDEDLGRAGRWQSPYHDTMLYHDDIVRQVLDVLDELEIAADTIVMYSTDNGPHMNSWPDAGMTPFRNEKNSNWEGAYRVPCIVRWPGRIPPGSVLNRIVSHNDWFVTLLAAAGNSGVQISTNTIPFDRPSTCPIDGHHGLPPRTFGPAAVTAGRVGWRS